MRAIDILKYLLTKAESETPEGHKIVVLNVPIDIVREIIDEQSDQRWFPCSEGLPQEDEPVFVYLFDDSPYIAWICGGRWHTEEFTLDKDEEPVAWMPLPEQWRGEGEPE